jgi:hypothetical protein
MTSIQCKIGIKPSSTLARITHRSPWLRVYATTETLRETKSDLVSLVYKSKGKAIPVTGRGGP